MCYPYRHKQLALRPAFRLLSRRRKTVNRFLHPISRKI